MHFCKNSHEFDGWRIKSLSGPAPLRPFVQYGVSLRFGRRLRRRRQRRRSRQREETRRSRTSRPSCAAIPCQRHGRGCRRVIGTAPPGDRFSATCPSVGQGAESFEGLRFGVGLGLATHPSSSWDQCCEYRTRQRPRPRASWRGGLCGAEGALAAHVECAGWLARNETAVRYL